MAEVKHLVLKADGSKTELGKSDVLLFPKINSSPLTNPPIDYSYFYILSDGVYEKNTEGTITKLSTTFGTTIGTSAEGNDSRINNGQTAYSWGSHASKYPLFDGTGAYGSWGINITGNSGAATLWGGRGADLNTIQSTFGHILTRSDADGIVRLSTKTDVQTFLAINNGSTLNNNISGNSAKATSTDRLTSPSNPSYYLEHEWNGSGWNLVSKNTANDEQAHIHKVNINGNALNATNWGGTPADFSNVPTNMGSILGYDTPTAKMMSFSQSQTRNFLGLGSNAYSSNDMFTVDGYSADENNKTNNGSSFWTPQTLNSFNGGYGVTLNVNGGIGWHNQLGFGTEGEFGFRQAISQSTNWSPWRKVWHDGNFNPANYLSLTGGTIVNGLNGRLNIGLATNYIYGDSSNNIILGNINGDALTLNSNKEATFASSVTATLFSGAGNGLTGTAANLNIGGSSAYVGGVSSNQIIYGGTGGRGSSNPGTFNNTNQKSGFYYGSNLPGSPNSDWQNWINIAGDDWASSNNYSFQLSHAFHTDELFVRRMTAGTPYTWRTIITSGNIGGQSVDRARYVYNNGTYSGSGWVEASDLGVRFAQVSKRSSGNFYIDDNFGCGIVGKYQADRYQGVFAMGDSYKLPEDGTTTGSLYGLTWTHSNVGGQSKAGLGYQLLVMENGGTQTAIGNGIWTRANITALGDVIAYASSDKRLKDNIKSIENPIEKILKIGGYTFDWNNKQSTHTGHDIGVIAQEIEEVLPELVTIRDNGYKAVKYDKIVALLIEGIKEQQLQIEELKKLIKK